MTPGTLTLQTLIELLRACSEELHHLHASIDAHDAWLARFAEGSP